ncbi:MAG: hypothetical protein KY468_04365 [Armatimonadetes bacterium]|nr:hypothetical protein [Armatimonadota bacterium]
MTPAPLASSNQRGPVSITSYEIGNEEVEVRLYEGPVRGSWAAIVCCNWRVLSLASGFSSADVVDAALEKAKEKLGLL